MITTRHIFRSALLQTLGRYALIDGVDLINRVSAEGRITEVHRFGLGDSDFYNLCIDYADWQDDDTMVKLIRLSVSITDGRVTEAGTILVSDGVVWVENNLFSSSGD